MTGQSSSERKSKKPVGRQRVSAKRKRGSGSGEPIVFRDEHGRFTKMDAMVIIDETGNPGRVRGQREHFIMTAAVTDNPRDFGDISKKHKQKQLKSGKLGRHTEESLRKTNELKARNDTSEGLEDVLNQIAKSGTEIYVMDVLKNDPPQWWNFRPKRHGGSSANGNKTLDRMLDAVISTTDGRNIGVVVDASVNYTSVKERTSCKSTEDKHVKGDAYDSTAGPYRNQLQTNDYVPYAIRLDSEKGGKELAKKLHAKFVKL